MFSLYKVYAVVLAESVIEDIEEEFCQEMRPGLGGGWVRWTIFMR